MTTKKKVLENSFLYIFSSLLVKAMGFLLLPIYTMFLTPDEYGITNLTMGFINVAIYIVGFSLYSAVLRFHTDYKNNQWKLKRLYGTIITFVILSGVISVILGVVFRNVLVETFFEGVDFYPIVFIALLSSLFVSLHAVHESILQGMQQGKKLTKLNLIVFASTTSLKIIFIGYFKLGATGFLVAQLITYIIYFIYMVIDLIKNELIKWTIDLQILKEILQYSIPLMPHNLSTRVASLASRIFINTSGTLADVGLYSIAMQFGNLIDIVQSSVNKAFQPWFFEMMNNNDKKSKKEIVNLSNVLLIVYSLVYMVIGLFSQEVVLLMTDNNYMMAWTVIPILVLGFSIKSMYYFYVNVIMFYKQAARKLFIATIIGSLMDIILAYMLVPRFGMYGSALAFVLAKAITVALVIYLSKLYANIGYRVMKMLSIIIPSLLFMILGLYFSYTKYLTEFSVGNLIYKILILISYISFVYLTNKQIIDKVVKSGQIQRIANRKRRKKC